MKKNGFTLIELLGVILILSILVLIAFPPLLNEIKKTKRGINETNDALIIDAAKEYYEDNINNYETIEGMTYCININLLEEKNYLSKNIKDEDLNDIDNTQKVKMIYRNGKFNYEITDTCNNNVLTRNNIEVPIVTEGKGLYKSTTDEGRYIYRGGDEESSKVPNFISLKENGTDTMYRILSFENDGTIKVVRDDSLGNIKWDTSDNRQNTAEGYYCTSANGCNVWGNQANTYYNDKTLSELNQDFYFYYYPDNQTNTLSIKYNDNYGTVTTDAYLNTYLNGASYYDTLDFKDKIDTHSFNVGGLFYYNGYDGGSKGLLKEKKEIQTFSWNGKIALMDITEFVETSLNDACTSVWSNFRYNPNNMNSNSSAIYSSGEWPCARQNWNYKFTFNQWFLSVMSYNSYSVWFVGSSGAFSTSGVTGTNIRVRPAFYLKSNVTLTGSGTELNPFRIVGD